MIKRLAALFILCAMGFAVSGCDKCGDWMKPRMLGPDVCKSDLPR